MPGEFKISGCCSSCDKPCFEVIQIWGENERYPGEPKRLGKPLEGAVRIAFMLLDGSKCDMTFCASCAEALTHEQYTELWRKVIRSWEREMSVTKPGEPRPDWFNKQFSNGLLSEMGRTPWQEIGNV